MPDPIRRAASVALHLLVVILLGIGFAALFSVATGSDFAAFLRSLAALPGQAVDERTRRYVLCLAIPLIGLPVSVALWCAPDVEAGRLRPGAVAGRALICGFAGTALFWFCVEVALVTAARGPSAVARFTLRHAWMFVILWSLVHVVLSCLAHAAALRLLHPRERG